MTIKYELFYCMTGGFGSHYNSAGTFEYMGKTEEECEKEALEEAYNLAVENYQGYEGCNGLRSETQVEQEDFIEEGITEYTRDDVQERYTEEIEGWIGYKVEKR